MLQGGLQRRASTGSEEGLELVNRSVSERQMVHRLHNPKQRVGKATVWERQAGVARAVPARKEVEMTSELKALKLQVWCSVVVS